MPRKRRHTPLRVFINNRPVGLLAREAGGAIEFRYAESWLARENAFPVSLSLPLREDAYRGEPVVAVFENLLPDSEALRRRVAEKVGANGFDAYSLLSRIGRDCVGALQFLPEDESLEETTRIQGEALDDAAIEALLLNLAQTPLGLTRDEDFRISVAGAQEKTALLRHEGRWRKPFGTTPTTHLFKTAIGRLPNGIDLSNSIENEYYCLELLRAFGLPVNAAEIVEFGATKALVIERFDRRWTMDGRLLRLPQEDCCQALSVPPTRKYQNEGGPGIVDILNLLKGSDIPAEDQKTFLKAQILFWLIGATDGHAKNFSLFLGPRGRFRLAPLYDVLTAQPSLDSRHILDKQMKLAMSVGKSRHYVMRFIKGRHFAQTAEAAGIAPQIATDALSEVIDSAEEAFTRVCASLPSDFPSQIPEVVQAAFFARAKAAHE